MKRKSKFGDLNSTAENVYSGTATFGKDYAWVVAIFCFIIAIPMLMFGISCLIKPPKYPVQVSFVVTAVTPVTVTIPGSQAMQNQPAIPASTSTSYTLQGTINTCGNNIITLKNYPNNIAIGQTITAYTKPNCADNEASESTDNMSIIGWILIGVSLVIILINVVKLYFVSKYKGIAAAQGAIGGFNLAKNFL